MKSELEETQQTVLATAARLLARREHSELELRQKLHLRGYTDELCDHAIAACYARKWLSEARFVEQFISERRARGRGPIKIMAELRAKGISESALETLQPGADPWLQTLRSVYAKRYHGEPAKDQKELAQRWRFLQNRGFTYEQIATVLEKLW